MNSHKLKHGDVVRSNQTGIYRMYIQYNPKDCNKLRCMSISAGSVYDLQYMVGDTLSEGETFVFNLIDLVKSVSAD